VRAVRSVAWMTAHGTASHLVHAFKYDGWRDLAHGMAVEMARLRWPPDVRRERAMLVPVPLTPWRERERGFNQADALAQALSPHWGVPVVPALTRTRMPVSQTRLTPGERLVNVTRAFTVASAGAAQLQGAHCVLIDDVVTTAATLIACAAALVDGGARIVSCATFGRAPAIGDRRSPLE
jgi:ComF family protein